MGKLLVLSHLIALCDAKATTTSHAHEVSERPPQKWFFASHHKTGTILLDAILEPIKGLFNPKLSYHLYYGHHIHESVSWSSDVFKYNLIDGQAWARIAPGGQRVVFRRVRALLLRASSAPPLRALHRRGRPFGGVAVVQHRRHRAPSGSRAA